MNNRDFAAELNAAREAQDWTAHERIWEERCHAEVCSDENAITLRFVLVAEFDEQDNKPLGTFGSMDAARDWIVAYDNSGSNELDGAELILTDMNDKQWLFLDDSWEVL